MPEEQQPAASRRWRWIAIAALVLAVGGVGATLAVLAQDSDPAEPAAVRGVPLDGIGADDVAEPAVEDAGSEPAESGGAAVHAATEEEPAAPAVAETGSEESAASPEADDPVAADPAPADQASADQVAPELVPTPVLAPSDLAPPNPIPAVDLATLGFGPYALPIAGACFPEFAGQLPGAPRAYRNGAHEGVDFYPGWACASIERGTAVLAIGEGRVIRADWGYVDLTTDAYFAMKARGFTGPDDLDTFRGRQVWVDHGDGIVARYAHLNGIAEGIVEGTRVSAGDVLAFVGESGTPGALREPGSEIHLHFELRVGDGYLGEGVGAEGALAFYRAVFPGGA